MKQAINNIKWFFNCRKCKCDHFCGHTAGKCKNCGGWGG